MKNLLLLAILAALSGGCCNSFNRDRPHRAQLPAYHPTPLPPVAGYPSTQPVGPPRPENPVYYPPVVTPLPANPQSTNIVVGDGNLRLELKTEDLNISKRTESAGAIKIKKYITTETKAVPTVVCHEEYEILRAPASGVSTLPFWEGEKWVEVPLSKETVSVVAVPHVYEVISINKKSVCVTNMVTGQVRTERVEVSNEAR